MGLKRLEINGYRSIAHMDIDAGRLLPWLERMEVESLIFYSHWIIFIKTWSKNGMKKEFLIHIILFGMKLVYVLHMIWKIF